VRIRLSSTGQVLAQAQVADTPAARLRGLLGRDGLRPGDGLILDPCSSVHTCFMRFSIDLVFVDRAGAVLRTIANVGPFRFVSGGRRARQTIELPAGTLATVRVVPGDRLRMEAV
jgi:uncharacterized membrane protein (UPF0127 family)